MSDNLNMRATISVDEVASLGNFTKILKEFQKLAKKFKPNVIDSKTQVEEASDNFSNMLQKLKSQAEGMNLKPIRFDKLTKDFKTYQKELDRAGKAAAESQKIYNAEIDKHKDNQNKGLIELHKKEMQRQQHLVRVNALKIKRLLSGEEEVQAKRAEALKDYDTKSKKSFEGAAKKAADVFGQLSSGQLSGTFSEMFKGMGKKASGIGANSTRERGGGGLIAKGVDKTFGRSMRMLGPILAGLGGLVAGFAAVFAIFTAIEGAGKALNKSLFSSGVTVADMASNSKDWENSLENITGLAGTKNIGFIQDWGISGEEQMALVGAFTQGNLSVKKMTEGVKGLNKQQGVLKNNMEVSLTYSKLFGQSAPEMATQQAKMMSEWGLNLEEVKDQFASIYEAAKNSSYGVKNFYSMILNVTSGLASYNVRMAETAGLLMKLNKVLSPERAGAFMQTIVGSYEKMSPTEAFADMLKRGVSETAKILQGGAIDAVISFQKAWGEQQAPLADMVEELGIKVDFSKDAKSVAEDLSKLSIEDQKKLLGAVAGNEKTAGMSNALFDLIDRSRVMTGKREDVARGLSNVTAGQELALKASSINYTGKGGLEDLMQSTAGRTAAMDATGLDNQGLKTLYEVVFKLNSNYASLEEQSKQMKELQDKITANPDDLEAKKALAELVKQQNTNAKTMGAVATAQGVSTATLNEFGGVEEGRALEGQQDYLTVRGGDLEEVAATQEDENIRIAKEQVEATTTLTDRIKLGIEAILKDMYDTFKPILEKMSEWLGHVYGAIVALLNGMGFDIGGGEVDKDLLTADENKKYQGYVGDARRLKEGAKEKLGQGEEEAKKLREELQGMKKGTDEEKAAYAKKEEELDKAEEVVEGLRAGVEVATQAFDTLVKRDRKEKWNFMNQEDRSTSTTRDRNRAGKASDREIYLPPEMLKAAQENLKGSSKEEQNMVRRVSELDEVAGAKLMKEIALSSGKTEDVSKIIKAASQEMLQNGESDLSKASKTAGIAAYTDSGVSARTLGMSDSEFTPIFENTLTQAFQTVAAKGISAEGAPAEMQKEVTRLLKLQQDARDASGVTPLLGEKKAVDSEYEEQKIIADGIQAMAKSQPNNKDLQDIWKKNKKKLEDLQKKKDSKDKELNEALIKRLPEEIVRLEELNKTKEFLASMGLGFDDPKMAERYADPLTRTKEDIAEVSSAFARLTPEIQGRIKENYASRLPEEITNPSTGVPLHDFIWQAGSPPKTWDVDKKDHLAMVGAKPGGPIDRINSKGVGGSGANVNINIYGDESKILRVVKKVFKDLNIA